MRNLRLLRTINLSNPQFLVTNKYCVVNVNDCGDSKSVHCFVFSGDLKVHRLHILSNVVDDCTLVVNLHEYITVHENVVIAGYTFLFNYLYIVLSDGHCIITLFGDEDNETKSYNLDINVKYVSWSPDINRTAIVDREDVLYLTNLSDDGPNILCKIALQNDTEEQNPSVNVGWGSIETQFRGTEGKYSKSKPIEPTVPEISDDTTVNICWKQNSTTLAVVYLCKLDRIRKVKIFDQDGILLNVTKDVYGLLTPIDWCSSRNLITCVQNLPNKKVVCFLEQNALRHGDFPVADSTEIHNLSWNNNGSILACHERDQRGEIISLWTTSNYKWYQKQCLVFSEHIAYFQWDFDVPNRLHVILGTGIYRMYEWMFQVIESGQQHNDDVNPHLVAVIKDKQLNLTPYRQVYQPPSLPYTTYFAPASINAVIFPNTRENSDPTLSRSALLYLSDNKCALMTYEESSQDLYCFSFGDDETEIEFETSLELSAWFWLLPNKLYFNWSRVDGHYFCDTQIDFETKSIVIKNMIKVKSAVLAITNQECDIIAHTEDGSLFIYHDSKFLPLKYGFLEPCFQLQAMGATALIALSEHRNLYINESIKWRDIVSFHWKEPFLVLIKMNSQLLITNVDILCTVPQFNEVQTRQIEPKSYLVTIVDDQVLLEMERGNLEVITPRPFTIYRMEDMLYQPKCYYDVFKMLRKQRINLNVIFDHNPKSFLKNLQNIVETVPDSMYLSTFVTELVDENVAKSMFPWKYISEEKMFQWEQDEKDPEDKVNQICDALIAAIKKYDVKKLINPLIAALVRRGNLEEAANYSIEYNEIDSLCHLTDPVSVYRAALASYNITSALRIIEHSKLDPSEYLPFIRELEATEDDYRKFKICNYLEKYGEALKFLAECPNKFDECVTYIKKHSLYVHALHIFSKKNESIKPVNPEYVQILTLIADFHFNNRLFEEAGVLYEKVGIYEKAFECYLSVGDWFAASSVFTLMNNRVSETDSYKMLYETLLKRGQYVDAAFIAFHYSKNCKQAVDAFLTAKKYCNALNVAKGLHNEGIIEDTIHPQLLTEAKTTIEHLQADRKTIEKYVRRLRNLREDARMFSDFLNDDSGSSSRSSASTTTKSADSSSSKNSRSSTSSTSSEKELRRRERRLWNLKSGNPREMPSLLAVIKDLLTTTDKLYPNMIPDLSKALVKTDEIESARALKAEYAVFLKFLQNTRDEVWPAIEVKEEGGFKDISIRCPPDITKSNEVLKLLNYE